jgi:hypothetical protein
MNLKNKTALVVDSGGQCVELASRLAEDFLHVWYTNSWQTAFPTVNDCFVGHNLPGVDVIPSAWGPEGNAADVVVFPHLHRGPEQVQMEKMGKAVWGARNGELLEISREGLKRVQEQAGLPTGEYEMVHGMKALRVYVQQNPGVIVKISLYRGSWETIKCESYDAVKAEFDRRQCILGPTAELVDFICEKPLNKRIEIGYDGWCIDGKFPRRVLFGLEDKEAGYLGRVIDADKLPACLKKVNEALAPAMRRYGQRGFVSSEVRVGEDGKGYLVDLTQRRPTPPGELYNQIDNLSEIIYEGAHGKVVDLETKHEWFCMLRIKSVAPFNQWQPVLFPAEIKPCVGIVRSMRDENGTYYAAPRQDEGEAVGGVGGFGATKEEAFEHCQNNAEKISGHGIHVTEGSLAKIEEEIAKAKKMGLDIAL